MILDKKCLLNQSLFLDIWKFHIIRMLCLININFATKVEYTIEI